MYEYTYISKSIISLYVSNAQYHPFQLQVLTIFGLDQFEIVFHFLPHFRATGKHKEAGNQ